MKIKVDIYLSSGAIASDVFDTSSPSVESFLDSFNHMLKHYSSIQVGSILILNKKDIIAIHVEEVRNDNKE